VGRSVEFWVEDCLIFGEEERVRGVAGVFGAAEDGDQGCVGLWD
jgi:hypothetical protein